jgi:hypothetical protein
MRRAYLLLACIGLLAPATLAGARIDVGADCAASLDILSQLRAALGQDSALAQLADSLANSSTPPAARVEQLRTEGLRTLDEAGDRILDSGEHTAEAMRQAKLSRPAESLSRALRDLRAAQGAFRGRLWPENTRGRGARGTTAPPGNASFSMPVGVGMRVVYEAVESYEQAIESFGLIRADVGAQAEGGYRVVPAVPDMPPSPNPSTNPIWEGTRGLRGWEARGRIGGAAYRTADALMGGRRADARQLAARMRAPVQDAQLAVQDLDRLLAPCTAQPTPSTPAKKRGMSKGARAGIVGGMLAAGGTAAAVLGSKSADGSTSGGGSSGGGSVRFVSNTPFTCSAAARSCSGGVTVEIPMVMNTGSVIVVSTSGFMGSVPVSPTAPAGVITVRLTKTFSDILNCPQTQRELGIYNATTLGSGTPTTASLTGLNIPVSCSS